MSSYFVNNKNILSRKWDIDESYLSIDWNSILCQNQLLVWHKWKFLLKNPNEIWDGMDVFFMFKRSELLFEKLDINWFKWWVCIYQEFDENLGKYISYLYKLQKDNVEDFNDIFEWLELWFKAIANDRVVSLDWQYKNIQEILSDINHWIEYNNYHSMLSFLFWFALIYGDFDIHEDTINWCKIFLPLWLYSNGFNDVFDNIIEWFSKNWFFLKCNLIQNKIWYTYQVSISDWEILENFKNFINQIDWEYIENNSKLDYMSEIWEQIQEFCEDPFDGYILKIQTK